MIKRDIQSELERLCQSYPVVTLTGPRQAGKTTLAKLTFPQFQYANLEHPEIRQLAQSDPNAFFKQFPWPVIIDEIQRVPELLSYIQVEVDNQNSNGMFILTGSHQLSLNEAVSQSLAGRTALLNLMPLSIHELNQAGYSTDRDDLLLNGFLPAVHAKQLEPNRAYRNYFQTYIERDLRQLIQLKNLSAFENFMKLLAGRIGQVLNLNSISNDLGVSSPTLAEWLSILEASFIVFRLYPFYENFGKRIIKSPKLYFSDVGIVTYLLGIENKSQIARDPLLGNLFENMVVLEAVKTRYNQGLDPNLYYYRDNNKNEVDLIYKKQRQLVPIEIKAAMTYHDNLIKGIRYYQKINPASNRGHLIYAGDLEFEKEMITVANYQHSYLIFQ